MSEPYAAKKARWLKIRNDFPSTLQSIPLHSIYAVAALSKEQKQVLAEVIGKITYINLAAKILLAQPGINAGELIQAITKSDDPIPEKAQELEIQPQNLKEENSDIDMQTSLPIPQDIRIHISPDDISALADTLQVFYPQMPRGTAEALAEHDQTMQDTLAVVVSARVAIQNAKSDFVVFSLYGVLEKYRNELASTIQNTPGLLLAIRKTGIPWQG